MEELRQDIPLVLFVIFILSLAIQLGYYLFVFSRTGFGKKKELTGTVKEPVSMIICARNESENLKKNLESWLDQDYPDFQVIVVNDCSFDDSADFLKEMAAKHARLKVVTIEEQEKYQHGKKFALTLGIKAASYEQLLLTDADCFPASRQWLSLMQRNFTPTVDIVLGYGKYRKTKSLLNKLIRFDTFYSALQFLSFSLMKKTYMGVGRNLAYKKQLFFKNKGFASHYHLLSGDDDLFINEVATADNTTVELSPEAFTISEPKTTFKAWFRQKKRHLSSSGLYKASHKRMLGALFFSHILFYIMLAALLILQYNWKIVLSLYILRLLIQMVIAGKSMKVLKELDLLPYLPLLDVFAVIFYPALGISALFNKKVKWK